MRPAPSNRWNELPSGRQANCRKPIHFAYDLSRIRLRTGARFLKEGVVMPEKETIERAREDEREGKAPSTQAGEFVREEIEHIREGKHGARSTKQAIAIGLSKARRAGVKLRPPKKGTTSKGTRRQAKRDLKKGAKRGPKKTSRRRARAAKKA